MDRTYFCEFILDTRKYLSIEEDWFFCSTWMETEYGFLFIHHEIFSFFLQAIICIIGAPGYITLLELDRISDVATILEVPHDIIEKYLHTYQISILLGNEEYVCRNSQTLRTHNLRIQESRSTTNKVPNDTYEIVDIDLVCYTLQAIDNIKTLGTLIAADMR